MKKTAPWIHGDLSMLLTFRNKMWFMGGWYNGRLPGHSASSHVWSSTDGVHWTQVTDSAAWVPRLWFSSVVYRNRMWVPGGWYSQDGKQWTQFKSNTIWKARHEHSAFVFH